MPACLLYAQARKAARDAFVEMVCANEEIGHRPTLRNAERHCSDDPRCQFTSLSPCLYFWTFVALFAQL